MNKNRNDFDYGYGHPLYAQSLSEVGFPIELPKSKGWILKRKITGFPYYDAMGCYPIFSCQDWSQLHLDLQSIGSEFVCLSVVTDPFGNYKESYLNKCFPDVCKLYKYHYITDLSQLPSSIISDHHMRNAKKAFQNVNVEICEDPKKNLDDWNRLYKNLINRHKIKGITTFSKKSFDKQFQVPGMTVFRAEKDNETIGMVLWYVQNQVTYYHLGAYSDIGYELKSSFAIFSTAIDYFADTNILWLNLGAGAGVNNDEKDGLSRFKHGWSTGIRPTYFCGRIFDKRKYDEIVSHKKILETDYFPAYRRGEFR